MHIHVEEKSITTSGGTGSKNTLPLQGGLLKRLLVDVGSDTRFRFNITDADSLPVERWGFHKDQINDTNLDIPVRGIHTLQVVDVSSDMTFTIRMYVQE